MEQNAEAYHPEAYPDKEKVEPIEKKENPNSAEIIPISDLKKQKREKSLQEDFIPRNMNLIATDGQEVGAYSYGFPTKLTVLNEGVYLVEQKTAAGEIVGRHIFGSEKDYNGEDNPPERRKKIAEIIQG